jgi:hypothetical protein
MCPGPNTPIMRRSGHFSRIGQDWSNLVYGYTRFPAHDFTLGLRLINTYLSLSAKEFFEVGTTSEEYSEVNAAELFREALARMGCTGDELNMLWAVLTCGTNVVLQGSNDAMLSDLDNLLPRRSPHD